MMRMLPLALACVMLALSGFVHGFWTGRWGPSVDIQAAAARCKNVPMTLGEWEGHDVEVDVHQLKLAEVDGYVSRRYVHRRTGDQVELLLLCGRAGPISVHTPDVCYRGAGYEAAGSQEQWRFAPHGDAGVAEFTTTCFAKPDLAPEPLRVFWSWSNTGPWQAPGNARLAFARSSVLYKLYVIRRIARVDEPLDGDPCLEFLRVLIPKLEQCLSTSS